MYYQFQKEDWQKIFPELTKDFFNTHSLIVIDINVIRQVLHKPELKKVSIQDNEVKVSVSYSAGGCVGGGNGVVYYIIVDNKDINNVVLKCNNTYRYSGTCDKPIIYLYPEEKAEITVTVGKPENLTHTYPKYEENWKVIASPNGDLIDINTGRSLYALYWEGVNTVEPKMTEGFVVKGSDTIEFLEEKLKVLGLNEREANEFIIYWLPQMENNEYNFIRFQTMEEINANMSLNIEPKPNTVIRVIMEWKALDEYIEIPEQQLETPERNGFVVVEWGGTKIN